MKQNSVLRCAVAVVLCFVLCAACAVTSFAAVASPSVTKPVISDYVTAAPAQGEVALTPIAEASKGTTAEDKAFAASYQTLTATLPETAAVSAAFNVAVDSSYLAKTENKISMKVDLKKDLTKTDAKVYVKLVGATLKLRSAADDAVVGFAFANSADAGLAVQTAVASDWIELPASAVSFGADGKMTLNLTFDNAADVQVYVSVVEPTATAPGTSDNAGQIPTFVWAIVAAASLVVIAAVVVYLVKKTKANKVSDTDARN